MTENSYFGITNKNRIEYIGEFESYFDAYCHTEYDDSCNNKSYLYIMSMRGMTDIHNQIIKILNDH